MNSFKDVVDAIDRERDYQTEKHGSLEKHGHTTAEWMAIMNHLLSEALDNWYEGDGPAMKLNILEIVATGVACLEQHGVAEREHKETVRVYGEI